MKLQSIVPIFSIFLVSYVLRLYIGEFLSLERFGQEEILFFKLVGQPLHIPQSSMIWIGLLNITLLWFIGKKLFNNKVALFTSLLYAISPWAAYLEAAGSVYIALLFALLLGFTGILLVRDNKTLIGGLLFAAASTFMFISTPVLFILTPLIVALTLKSKLITFSKLKLFLVPLIIVFLGGVFLVGNNYTEFNNLLKKDAGLFSNVGLLNAVNSFRGESSQTQFAILGKVIENKYTYFPQHVMFNTLKHFIPLTYFTAEYKLFNFSFSSPVFLGFLIPFLLGLASWYKLVTINKLYPVLFLLLAAPSVLSENSPDLVKLILLSPVIFFTISYGLFKLTNTALIAVTLVLVLIQGLVFLSDVSLREPVRLEKFLEDR